MMDALTRRPGCSGYDVLWLPGMDHAGIATQNVVERTSPNRGQEPLRLHGREAVRRRVWEWKERVRRPDPRPDAPPRRRRRLVARAVHHGRGLSRAVQTIFKRLYDDDLIYRAERIINWCPR
jgi:valyl-tRNA synthetase